MRLDKLEIQALQYAFENFKGEVYLFGSRLDDSAKGGDIDLVAVPKGKVNTLKLSIELQKRFFLKCEQKLDVIIYKKDNPFCQEVMKHAQKIDIHSIG